LRLCGAFVVRFRRRLAGVEFHWLRFGCISREFLSGERLALHDIGILTLSGGALDPMVVRSGAIFSISVGCAMIVFFLRNQRLPIGDGDLVIVRMDFRKRQKAVAIAAVVDESRLQRRLNARDFGKINVTAELFAVGALEIEFFDAVAA